MELDFTLTHYNKLLTFFLDKHIFTVQSYLSSCPHSDFIILRHDVDRSPQNALKMATLEHELGVVSTYYFRYKKGVFIPDVIKAIAKMGHEIGYHYEVMAKTNGDHEKAISIFKHELNEFREICTVQTISMHGSPLSKYDNRELWNSYDYREYGIIGDAHISISDDEILYFTDTGRSWGNEFNLRDRINARRSKVNVKTTTDIIKHMKNNDIDKYYISIHPERWGYNMINYSYGWIRDMIFNTGKYLLSHIIKY